MIAKFIRKACIYLLIYWLLNVLTVVLLLHQFAVSAEHLEVDIEDMWFHDADQDL